MKSLTLEAKDDTPGVILDKENQTFEIIGKSLPEDVMDFYQPIYEWLEEYVKNPNPETIFTMKIDYFNSASHKAINNLLDILAEIKDSGNSVLIKWHFLREDEDMLESGNDYADLTGLDFDYVGYD